MPWQFFCKGGQAAELAVAGQMNDPALAHVMSIVLMLGQAGRNPGSTHDDQRFAVTTYAGQQHLSRLRCSADLAHLRCLHQRWMTTAAATMLFFFMCTILASA